MGMTIEEAIKYYENKNVVLTEEEALANTIALNTMRKYQQLENFARWVAAEVIDEDMWALNHLSFAELACRKLVKLGIMQESNGEYLYEEVNNGNDDRGDQCSTSQG